MTGLEYILEVHRRERAQAQAITDLIVLVLFGIVMLTKWLCC